MSENDLRTDESDVVEQSHTVPDDVAESPDAPEADAYEQRRDLVEREPERTHLPDDVDPADAYEQALVVEYDEDDYR